MNSLGDVLMVLSEPLHVERRLVGFQNADVIPVVILLLKPFS